MRVALECHGATPGHHQNAPTSRVGFSETTLRVDEARMVLGWHRPRPVSSPERPGPSSGGPIDEASESGLDHKAQDVTRAGNPVWIPIQGDCPKRISRRKGGFCEERNPGGDHLDLTKTFLIPLESSAATRMPRRRRYDFGI